MHTGKHGDALGQVGGGDGRRAEEAARGIGDVQEVQRQLLGGREINSKALDECVALDVGRGWLGASFREARLWPSNSFGRGWAFYGGAFRG